MSRYPSGMTERLGWMAGRLARWLTANVHLDRREVEQLRELSQHGTIVYVLRQRSLLDYLLFNWLMLREGLPLAAFANGVSARWFVSFRERAGRTFRRGAAAVRHASNDREAVGEAVENGRPVMIFLRARGSRMFGDARTRLAAARPGGDLLDEILGRAGRVDRPVYLVPMSLFRGRIIRRQASRLSTIAYSVHDAPNDLKKLATYAFNRQDMILTVGRVIDLRGFISANRPLGRSGLSRRLTHRLQRELAQEERAVWGPLVLDREAVAERVFEGREVAADIQKIAQDRGITERKAWREARRYFWEMAANFNGIAFGIIEMLFHQIWKRAFSGVEIRGLDRVAERVKQHPVVLVPCHRSHFDYMVLSYIFRENFLSPPHIAAGINLKFWPVSSLLRGSGAFFMRRTFADNELYKLVFHRYLMTLIRLGYTMEFFIEGGRSRTGKILSPKLGLLAGIVRAFLQGARRDLYLVPVSIHYGRIAEENAYDAESSGGAKQKESFSALLRARNVLRQRHGTVYVTFAEPLSLKGLLGDRRQVLAEGIGEEGSEEAQRRFVQKLGFQLLRDVNRVAVVGATSMSATVLLSASEGSRGYEEFARSAQMLAELLRWQGVTFTSSLERNLAAGEFSEITAFLGAAKLVEEVEQDGAIELRVPVGKRKVLDFYKNNSIHFFLLPSIVAHAMLRGVSRRELSSEVWWWLELFRWEFPLPERDELDAEVQRIVDYLRAHGAWVNGRGARVPLVHALVGILENFREAYWITVRTASQVDGEVSRAQFLTRVRRCFDAAMLLGEVEKPEAASNQVFANAVSYLADAGFLERETRRGEKDVWLRPGPQWSRLPEVADRIGAALVVARETSLTSADALDGQVSRLSA